MVFHREEIQEARQRGKSISEIRSGGTVESSQMRKTAVDVPRCESCRENLGETTVTHYTGGPRKEANEQKQAERHTWVKNMAVLKIQRFFRHMLSKKKLFQIMERKELEQVEKEDFFQKKR